MEATQINKITKEKNKTKTVYTNLTAPTNTMDACLGLSTTAANNLFRNFTKLKV